MLKGKKISAEPRPQVVKTSSASTSVIIFHFYPHSVLYLSSTHSSGSNTFLQTFKNITLTGKKKLTPTLALSNLTSWLYQVDSFKIAILNIDLNLSSWLSLTLMGLVWGLGRCTSMHSVFVPLSFTRLIFTLLDFYFNAYHNSQSPTNPKQAQSLPVTYPSSRLLTACSHRLQHQSTSHSLVLFVFVISWRPAGFEPRSVIFVCVSTSLDLWRARFRIRPRYGLSF